MIGYSSGVNGKKIKLRGKISLGFIAAKKLFVTAKRFATAKRFSMEKSKMDEKPLLGSSQRRRSPRQSFCSLWRRGSLLKDHSPVRYGEDAILRDEDAVCHDKDVRHDEGYCSPWRRESCLKY